MKKKYLVSGIKPNASSALSQSGYRGRERPRASDDRAGGKALAWVKFASRARGLVGSQAGPNRGSDDRMH